MKRNRDCRMFVSVLILILLFTGFPFSPGAGAAGTTTSVAYEFNEDGNAEGWMQFRNGVESYRVQEGSLHLKLNGTDPFWYGPEPVGLTASADQTITVRMRATKGDSVAFYFDTTLYPGLSQSKRILIPIKADGEFNEYTVNAGVHPNWKGVVQKLRMDLEPAASVPSEVSVDYIRIADHSDFGFEFSGTDGWRSVQDLSDLQAQSGSVTAYVYGSRPSMESGFIGEPADKLGEIKIRTRLTGGSADAMRISFTTEDSPDYTDANEIRIPIIAGGDYQEYLVKMWEHPSWKGTIRSVRISLDYTGPQQGAVWETDYVRFQSVTLPVFDWNRDGDAQGWIPIHHLTPFRIADGLLQTTVTGSDPHLGIDNLVGVIGERDKSLKIRMAATAGNFVSIFFATDTAPAYAETRRFDFTITADGTMRDYVIPVGDHPMWKGKITKLRFDLEGGERTNAVLTFDEVRLQSSPAGATMNVKRSKPALHAGEDAEITVDLSNTGGKAFFSPQAELILSEGLSLNGGNGVQRLPDLRPGETKTVTWKVKAVSESAANVGVRLQAAGYEQGYSVALPIVKAHAAVPGGRPESTRAYVDPQTGDAVLENPNVRFVAPKSGFGYGQYQVFGWDDAQGWKQMASSQPFAGAVVRQDENSAETVAFHPTRAAAAGTASEQRLTFQGETSDTAGRRWSYQFEFALKDGDLQIRSQQRIQSDRDAELLNMTGPVLTVGEGSFGSWKEEALFPGLEWLVGEETSSSKLDIHTPDYLRLVPHPYKITVPLMAVREGGLLVSLSWDPHQKWDGVNELPAAKFASPNWVENQSNHVLGLSALSVPTWVKENQELAHTAYPLKAGRPIELKSGITVSKADSVAEAVDLYMKQEGALPAVPQVYDFQKQVDLGLDAYLRTYWDPATSGWRHVNIPSWGTNQYPADMVSLKLLGMSQPDRKPEVEKVISKALGAMADKKKLGDPDYHIPQFQAAFHVGYMEEMLAGLKAEMQALMDTQIASGAWVYDRENAYNPPLGSNGTPLLGQTAQNAKLLLKYAAMTGDTKAEEAGYKGLAALDAMGKVPRAGQPWEVPLHAPDILAAGHAAGAYLQAYKMTGDNGYLQKSAEWAQAGLPFVYTWGVQERPMMEYGTIPIFGASAYINSWLASPVQWNGLVYAYELMDLSLYDTSGPWKQVADGILASAEKQQASGENETWRGGYPDNWRLISNSRSDTVMLNPEEIVKTVFMKRFVENKGPNPDVHSVTIPGCPEPVAGKKQCSETRVTSLAAINDQSPADTKHLVSFELKYPAGETSYVLVAKRENPRKITINDVELSVAGDLNAAAEGWSYMEDSRYLLLKIRHTGQDQVKIHY
ncbi:hypothetical protein J31TS4_27600 [Paenibacillus sp. J31TS4]|uniref:hypothetical protein n=1 Tax=Paenibacillus sp. J31TS4 TaxID=2807195 RepID=UPI001B2566D5|nr:hypothetical protein [Paenibacillus sp. J31TS4]GIP39480.1 hypothetical protein J31TS4_27600 [Paenibacillus sp. J31TS4]